MKIWQRIFLTTLAIVICSVMVIGLYLLRNQFQMELDGQAKNAQMLHEELVEGFRESIDNYKSEIGVKMLSDNDFQYIISKNIRTMAISDYGIRTTVNGEYINSNRYIREGLYRRYELNRGEMKYEIERIDEDYYLIMGSLCQVSGRDLYIFTTLELTELYERHESQINYLQTVAMITSLIAAFILLLLVKVQLNPLKKLQTGIHDIADGDYGKKLEIKGSSELKELTEDINQMSDKIADNMREMEEMLDNRTVFIGNMAHEMKTPLTAILGFSDIITINPRLTREQVVEYSEYIYKEALRLKGMSGKLLELVQLQEDKVNNEVVNIKELLSEIIKTEKVVFEKENVSIKKNLCKAYIMADRDLLKSLFYNIMDNAKKATETGGFIEVRSTVDDKFAYVEIIDYGIGIPEEDLKKVTEPFYMVDKSRTRKHGGAGLGLALCKKIVLLSNGTMDIKSKVGEGSTFTFSFPLVTGGGSDEKK